MPLHEREEEHEEVALDEALTNLPNLLAKRRKLLDEREKELKKAADKLEQEKASLGSGDASDVIHLNVGGTLMATLRSTLTYVEGSLLASRFSGRWDDTIAKDKYGHFFVDQSFELFQLMIDFIRSKQNHKNDSAIAPEPPSLSDFANNQRKYDDFKLMVAYFGVSSVFFPPEPDSDQPEQMVNSRQNHQTVAANGKWVSFVAYLLDQSSLVYYLFSGFSHRLSAHKQNFFYFAGKNRYIGTFDTPEKAALGLQIVQEKLKDVTKKLAEGPAKKLFIAARDAAHDAVANYKE